MLVLSNNKRILFCWIGLIALILLEYGLFCNYLLREIVPFYPANYDQAWYLYESYALYESFLKVGIKNTLLAMSPVPQTYLFPIQAALIFILFSPSRFVALSINFIYFALLQLAGFALVKRCTKSYLFSFLFIGLLLSTNTVNWANDFRADFIAFCLYGLVCCAVIYSGVFLSTKKTWIVLALGTLLIGMRFIASVYIFGLLLSLLTGYISQFIFFKRISKIDALKKRIKNLFICLGGLIAVFSPIMWFTRHMIYNYYVVGHVLGDERHMRLKDALRGIKVIEIFYYPSVFIQYHVTAPLLKFLFVLFTIFILAYLGSRFFEKKIVQPKEVENNKLYDKNNFIFLILAILVPLAVLTLDEAKSVLVISIVLTPFVLLTVASFSFLYNRISCYFPKITFFLLSLTSTLFLLYGAKHFLNQALRVEGQHHFPDDASYIITRMTDDIGNYAGQLRWNNIIAANDKPVDYIVAPISPFYYERHGVLFNVFAAKLGATIVSPITKGEALESLAKADIFISNLTDYVPNNIYPFEASIYSYRKELIAYADKHMVQLDRYFLSNQLYQVYVRPDVRLDGSKDDWVTSEGLMVTVPAVVANRAKSIILSGSSNFKWLANRHLRVLAQDENKRWLVASVDIKGDHYKIVVDIPPKLFHYRPMTIYLSFSDHFTDKAKMKKLVLQMPDKKQVVLNKDVIGDE